MLGVSFSQGSIKKLKISNQGQTKTEGPSRVEILGIDFLGVEVFPGVEAETGGDLADHPFLQFIIPPRS